MTPIMYRIEFGGKPYLEPVKKFAVSRDCRIAALVMKNNQILVYNVSFILNILYFFNSYLSKIASNILNL
jgi:hypothetical protein